MSRSIPSSRSEGGTPSPDAGRWFARLSDVSTRISDTIRSMPPDERSERLGVGAGGDMTAAVDRAAEDAMLDALRAMAAEDGIGMTVVSEEAGVVAIGDAAGGPVVVVDPVDGSQNAKRGAPLFSTSVAVADGTAMGSVRLAYVRDHSTGEEFTAERGVGAWLDGRSLGPPTGPSRIRLLAVEGASALHSLHAAAQSMVGQVGGLRSLGSIALSMCWVAAGRMDGFIGLKPLRSVDVAAAQLILREAGCQVGFPGVEDLDACPLDLEGRRWVMATSEEGQLEGLRATLDAAVAAG